MKQTLLFLTEFYVMSSVTKYAKLGPCKMSVVTQGDSASFREH